MQFLFERGQISGKNLKVRRLGGRTRGVFGGRPNRVIYSGFPGRYGGGGTRLRAVSCPVGGGVGVSNIPGSLNLERGDGC